MKNPENLYDAQIILGTSKTDKFIMSAVINMSVLLFYITFYDIMCILGCFDLNHVTARVTRWLNLLCTSVIGCILIAYQANHYLVAELYCII